MHTACRSAMALVCAMLPACFGSEVSGTITIQRGVSTKVLAPGVYDLRGMAASHGSSAATKDNAFDRVAVWLESDSQAAPAPISATMQQRQQRLEPALLIIPVGSTVDFPNLDPIFHNIFSLSRTQSFDLGYYPQGRSRSVKFSRAGIVQVYCHVHPNMYGAIIVTASPWFGKPAADGAFSWSDVPAGKYRLAVWQKNVGVVHKDIVVPSVGSIRANVAIPEDDMQN